MVFIRRMIKGDVENLMQYEEGSRRYVDPLNLRFGAVDSLTGEK